MRLVFIFGPAASGKLTIARQVAERTGFALFHNHLVVDAVGAVFPFGSAAFVRLREQFWLDVFTAAAAEGRSLIFTFAPEATVAAGFPERAAALVAAAGGSTSFVRLEISRAAQEARVEDPSRAAFGKLRSVDLLHTLRAKFDAAEAAMPPADVTIDTTATTPVKAADQIVTAIGL